MLLGATALSVGLVLGDRADAQARPDCPVSFVSPQAALDQGIGAYQAGFYSIAIPALKCAASHGMFLAQYHLARLYADNAGSTTDHKRAYDLYRAIVEEHAPSIDVDDDARAPYVGKSLLAFGKYWLHGLAEVGLDPNPEQAAFLFNQAATFFRDQDAQFELAKLYLKGEGVREDHRKARGWLTTLSREGHAAAQAFFADLLWRGKIVDKDERQALALITIAVENAPPHERIWIEDIYQSIFCGTGSGIRSQADGLIASFRKLYSPRSGAVPPDRFGFGAGPTRTCASGEEVKMPTRESRAGEATPPAGSRMLDVRGQGQ